MHLKKSKRIKSKIRKYPRKSARKSLKRRKSVKKSLKRRKSVRKSLKGRKSVRKSLKGRKSVRKSLKGRKLYDGMDFTHDLTSISVPKPKHIIKLEKYINDIKLFYEKSFTYTISSFKMFLNTEINNDTFDFIKELFNFDRNLDINAVYYNQSTILVQIIVSGMYDEFEEFIISIDPLYDIEKESKLNCSRRKSPYFKKQHKGIKLKSSVKNEIKRNIIGFIGDLDVTQFLLPEDKKDEDKIFEIKKFIYYSVCVDTNIRRYLMRYYLLNFIKSSQFQEYKDVISLNTYSSDIKTQKIINKFLMYIGEYRIIPYIPVKFTKKDGKQYTFTSCGESTLLNLLNYYFIDDSGMFDVNKGEFSSELEGFYSTYSSIKEQLKDIKNTTKDWLEVVSNLKKSDEEEKEVPLYNEDGDIHNNIKNIIFILKKILNIKEKDIDIEKILGKISLNDIKIVDENENQIKFFLDEKFEVFFRPGHGEIIPINSGKISSSTLTLNKNTDFSVLYYNIFYPINYKKDYQRELSNQVLQIIKNYTYIQTILQIFLSKITILNLSRTDLKELPENISYLTGLTKLHLLNNKLEKLPENIGSLNKLEILGLGGNKIENLPETIGGLTSLRDLFLPYNQLKKLPESIGELTKLKILDVRSNKLENLSESIGKLTNLINLDLSNNELEKLPDSICELTMLTNINFYNNQLKEIPESMYKLTKLEYLELSDNNLIKLPEKIGELTSLKELALVNNQLEKLPESIGNLTNLLTLELLNNKLEKLPESICKLTNLQYLELSDNNLTKLPECISKLTKCKINM